MKPDPDCERCEGRGMVDCAICEPRAYCPHKPIDEDGNYDPDDCPVCMVEDDGAEEDEDLHPVERSPRMADEEVWL